MLYRYVPWIKYHCAGSRAGVIPYCGTVLDKIDTHSFDYSLCELDICGFLGTDRIKGSTHPAENENYLR